jgi:hypothetical protein
VAEKVNIILCSSQIPEEFLTDDVLVEIGTIFFQPQRVPQTFNFSNFVVGFVFGSLDKLVSMNQLALDLFTEFHVKYFHKKVKNLTFPENTVHYASYDPKDQISFGSQSSVYKGPPFFPSSA